MTDLKKMGFQRPVFRQSPPRVTGDILKDSWANGLGVLLDKEFPDLILLEESFDGLVGMHSVTKKSEMY